MIQVSIVIVNYNGFELLRACIQSIKKYTRGVAYEIIVVDNGSPGGDVRRELDGIDGIILLCSAENIGFAKANNIGISHAQGEFILILNNDTLFREDTLSILYNYAVGKDPMIIGCKLLNEDGSHQVCIAAKDNVCNAIGENLFLYKLFPKSRVWNKYYQNEIDISSPAETDVVKGAFMFLPASLMRRLGCFDEEFFFYAEETDLCYSARTLGYTVLYYPGTSIVHYGGAATEQQPWFMFKNLHRAKRTLFRKQFSGMERLALYLFHYLGIVLRIFIYAAAGLLLFRGWWLKKSWFYARMLFSR